MKNSLKTLALIYSKTSYLASQIILFTLVCALISFIQNIGQLSSILGYDLELGKKFFLMQKVILNFYTDNLSYGTLVLYLLLAFLFSYNIILTWYYFKKRASLSGLSSLSLSGLLALVGSGCAACGGVLLSSILSVLGGASLVALLPYGGSEFLFCAIAILAYSIITISKKINDPLVC